MSKTERDPLGPGFGWRLRSELDRVQPRFSSPRYLASARRLGAWRLAPAALAIAFTGLLGLTAYAATGSVNPTVWTERIVTVIHPIPPTPTPEVSPSPAAPLAAPPAAPVHKATSQPSERPEPSGRSQPTPSPEPRESPEPSDHPGAYPSGGWPTPSPNPGDH